MTAPSQAEQALAQVLAELEQLKALVGRITYQVTASHISTDGAVVEIRRLLGVTPHTSELPTVEEWEQQTANAVDGAS